MITLNIFIVLFDTVKY